MPRLNMLDVAKLNGNDRAVALIEENQTFAPEVEKFPMRRIVGTAYHTVTRTAYAGIGFRAVNEGQQPTKSEYKKDLVETFVLSGIIQADKAAAMAYDEGPERWQALEASGTTRNTLIKLGAQIWYGLTEDPKGFPGIKAALPFAAGVAAGTVINATGTTALTASSAYFVKFGEQDVTLIAGRGEPLALSDFREQQVTDGGGAYFPAYVADLTGWVGLQVGNVNCVRRIANLTEDSGKGLTDALIARALATFPVGYRPDAIFINRRSAMQLQLSRTVVLQGGAPGNAKGDSANIAPIPESAFGIPIVITDSIRSNDAIEA